MKFQFWTKLKEQFNQSTGGAPSSDGPSQESSTPVLDVLAPLESLRQAALSTDEESLQEGLRKAARQAALEEEKRVIAEHRKAMLEDIVALHHQMSTGLEAEQLEELSSGLKETLGVYAGRDSDSLADRGMAAILRHIHDDSLAHGWSRLERAREQAELAWPPPTGISPSATPEEVKKKTELHNVIIHKDFLEYDLKILAELIVGHVPAWRAVYPERGGVVWTATSMQAVGAAFAAQRHNELVELGQNHIDEIRKLVAQRLEPALAPIQAEFKKGVQSLQHAARLSSDACKICEKIAPEAFWEVVGARCSAV